MPLTADKKFKVNISNDKLIVTLSVHTSDPLNNVDCGEILSQVSGMKIVLDDEGKKAVQDYVDKLNQNEIPESAVIARGRAPKHDLPGQVEILFTQSMHSNPQEGESPEATKQSHYNRSSIITVKQNQELLRLIPPQQGDNGVDIFGREIARKLGRDAQIRLGSNVRQDGDTIYATSGGTVVFHDDKISVESILNISGDVDFSVGNIHFSGDIQIAKNVLDMFKVSGDRDIVIQGVAEAAEIHAQRDLTVKGGIAGKEKGIFSAGQDLKTKYITNSQVQVGRNVQVEKEIVQCDLSCRGRLTIKNGELIGGRTVATGGLTVKTLGSEANVKTIIEVGIDPELRDTYQQLAPVIRQHRQKAEKVKLTVEPLLQNQKRLSHEQKEKATELLCQASELEESADQMLEQICRIAANKQNETLPEILVSGTLYSGCVIRFPGIQVIISTALAGPIKIVPQKKDGVLTVIAEDQNAGSTHNLGGTPWEKQFWKNLEQLINPQMTNEMPQT